MTNSKVLLYNYLIIITNGMLIINIKMSNRSIDET